MALTFTDGIAFIGFLSVVFGVSLYASRKERDTKDYFLAGRNLTWWLIGFSLIASNISTEHFVGMAGAGFGEAGLAIASYEWIGAITLVVVALWLLPLFLKLGIYTMPEFLQYRYGPQARTLMAIYMMIAYIGVAIAAVLYSGALGLKTIFGLDLTIGIWLIGILAGAYTIYGGLKAVVWSDMIQGSALLIGGSVVALLGLNAVGGLDLFLSENGDKLHTILPADHPDIPWTAMLFGIWIPNFFYFGLNQFITQRTLGSKSLAHGQDGIIFAAFIKLIIPFIIVFPGIMAFQLYSDQITTGDQAYAILVQNLLPEGFRGIMFAALFGAVMSSLDSMLNSTATIFTMDIYAQHINKTSSTKQQLKIGRIATALFVVLGCLIAPMPGKFEGVFRYIQMVWGFISPGIVAVFFFGIINRHAPLSAALWGMGLSIPVYGVLNWGFPNIAFLNHMAISFSIIIAVMLIITKINPLSEPVEFKENGELDLTPSSRARKLSIFIIISTILLYIIFW